MPETATDFIAGLYADVTAIILAQWPEVAARAGKPGLSVANGIWTAEHLDGVPYAEITPPYAVIHVADLTASDDYGTTNDSYVAVTDVYLVQQVKGPLSGIQTKLNGLRRRIYSGSPAPAAMQVLRVKGMTWGDDLVPNQFFAAKKMSHRAGRLRVTLLIQDSYFADRT